MTVPGEGNHEAIKGLPFELPPASPTGVLATIREIARLRVREVTVLEDVGAVGDNPLVTDKRYVAESYRYAGNLLQRHLLYVFPELDADLVLGAIDAAARDITATSESERQGE